jgi:nitroreductase
MSDLYELMRRRRMVRSFSDEPVDPDALERILDVARRGPTAGHSQGVELVVVTDPGKRRAIAEPSDAMLTASGMENFLAQAPVHVVVCVSPEIYRSRYRESDKQRVVASVDEDTLWTVPFWYTDAGAAKMLLLLGAVQEGLGAAFVGVLPHQHDALHELLGIPPDFLIIGITLLGHPSERAVAFGDVSATTRPRRALQDVVHREHW